jgi:polyferredoxin
LSAQNFEYSDFFISFSFRKTFSPGTTLIIGCSLSRLVFRSDTFMDTRYDNRVTFAIHFIMMAPAWCMWVCCGTFLEEIITRKRVYNVDQLQHWVIE